MAVMLIQSTDPNFSRYLKKNPAGGMTSKTMRSGVLSGWYPNGDAQKYALWFREASTENSFSSEDSKNYLDLTQYASTYFVFQSMTTLFNQVLKLDMEQPISGVVHEVRIPNVQLRTEKTFHHLCMFIEPGLYTLTKKSESNSMALYDIHIHSDGGFNGFMMKVYLLFYLLHADLYASDIVFMEGMITKVVGMMNELNCPYFLWYWFKKNVLIKPKFYNELEGELGKNSSDGKMYLEFGNTQQQRKAFVDKHIGNFDMNILDVGCGEGDYVLPYAKKLRDTGHSIVGVDIDKNITTKLARKLEERHQANANVVNSLDEVTLKGQHDIICIEVIEHMPLEDAKTLVVKLAQRDFRKLIISTPNAEFNRFYTTLNGSFRHDDHHFEFDRQEFQTFITECLAEVGGNFNVRDFGVGDQVADISMAQGCIITKE